MEASFANIHAFIELGSNFSQDVHESNRSFTAPSPAPVDQAPSQSQTEPSVGNPRIGCGPGGETQEPGQAESATFSFLAALRAAGIQVPQGVDISDGSQGVAFFGCAVCERSGRGFAGFSGCCDQAGEHRQCVVRHFAA